MLGSLWGKNFDKTIFSLLPICSRVFVQLTIYMKESLASDYLNPEEKKWIFFSIDDVAVKDGCVGQ